MAPPTNLIRPIFLAACFLTNLNPIRSEDETTAECQRYEEFIQERYPIDYSCTCSIQEEGVTEGPVLFANCTTPMVACSGDTIPFHESMRWSGKNGSFKGLHSYAERSMHLTDTGEVIRLAYERMPFASQDSTTCKLFVTNTQEGGEPSFDNSASTAEEQECNSCDLRKVCTSSTDMRFFANCTNIIPGAVIDQCSGSGYDGTIFQVLDRANHKEGSCPANSPPWTPPDVIPPAPSVAKNDTGIPPVSVPVPAPSPSPSPSTTVPVPVPVSVVRLTSGVSSIQTCFIAVMVPVVALLTLLP